MKNRQLHLAKRPTGMPTMEHFNFVETTVPEVKEGQVLLKTIYLSVDPYMRGRMNDTKSYIAPFGLNEMLAGGAIAEVTDSKSDQLQVGDVVIGMLNWQEYAVVDANQVRKIDTSIAPASSYLGILGMPGLTAYFGLIDIGQPKEGETVVVSGAAGAVGSTVGQIAKIKGTRVVGIAGSDEKVDYLVNELGFDAAINYKKVDNMKQAIADACPNGVDVYFDNVGGDISDAVIANLNRHARIPLCGAISSYNKEGEDLGPRIQTALIKTSTLMKAYVYNDYIDQVPEAAKQMAIWLGEGKLKYQETISEGFEQIPDAFFGLFHGNNLGKQLVKIADISK